MQPLHRFSGGLVYMADLSPLHQADIFEALRAAWPEEPGSAWAELHRRVADIQRLGYAINRTSEKESGLAVPIRHAGRLVGAVGMQWITRSVKREEVINRYLPAVQGVALRIATRLGDRPDLPS